MDELANFNYESICIIVGVISATCSLSVVLTAIVFPSMLKRKLFMHILVMMSLSDAIASTAYAFGFAEGPLCSTQSFLMNFFYRGTWFWTTMLSFQLHNLVLHGKPYFSLLAMHIICWSLNIILQFIPFATNYYGEDDEATGKVTCYIANGSNAKASHIWEIVTFVIPLFCCLLLMSYFSLQMLLKYWYQDLSLYPLISSAINMTGLYPFGLILMWIPHAIFALIYNIAPSLGYPDNIDWGILYTPLLFFSFAWGGLYGVLLAAIFFIKGSEARSRWYVLLCGVSDVPIHISLRSDFEDYSFVDSSFTHNGSESYSSKSAQEYFLLAAGDDDLSIGKPLMRREISQTSLMTEMDV